MSEYMTVVFKKSVTDFDKNPLHIKSEFGDVVAIARDDHLEGVSEMTVDGFIEYFSKEYTLDSHSADEFMQIIAHELAKLGTIRIKEEV